MKRTTAVVVGLALLVLGSGAIVAANPVGQATTPDDGAETPDDGAETPDDGAETPDNGTDNVSADRPLQFEDQAVANATVTVASANLSNGGFVAIYNASGTLLGVSDYLDSGAQQNVTVNLTRTVDFPEANATDGENVTDGDQGANATQSTTLFAIAHRDTVANQQFEYLASGGDDDVPYATDQGIVIDIATVTPAADGDGAPTPTPTPDGETPTPDGEDTPTPDGEATPTPDGEMTPDGEATPDGEMTPDGEATPAEGNTTDGNATG